MLRQIQIVTTSSTRPKLETILQSKYKRNQYYCEWYKTKLTRQQKCVRETTETIYRGKRRPKTKSNFELIDRKDIRLKKHKYWRGKRRIVVILLMPCEKKNEQFHTLRVHQKVYA